MKEIKINDKYLFSLLIKAFIILFTFWTIVYIVVILLSLLNLEIEILKEQNNSTAILILFFITYIIAGLASFLYYNLIKNSNSIMLEDNGIKIKHGLLAKKETFISYKDIKSAHCDDDSLSVIDKMLKISVLKIHSGETISMVGITNGIEIVNEINHMIELNKEKKADPMTIMMEEIKSLKNEIAELKENMQKVKSARKPEQNEKRKKFKLGPFDEIIN